MIAGVEPISSPPRKSCKVSLQFLHEKPAADRELVAAEDRHWLVAGYRQLLPVGTQIERHLRGAVTDVLLQPGSLTRAQLAFGVLEDLDFDREASRSVAIAIEYFHTASLLFDDLPAMDDASERRGRPCAHRVHGEAAAILAALVLINHAYGLLWQVLAGLPEAQSRRAAAELGACLGLGGVLNGQALDLYWGEGAGGAEAVERVARGKTATLVRLSLVLPALLGGAEAPPLEALAEAWGLAYQALDDFKDVLDDHQEVGKTVGRDALLGRPNLPLATGCEAAFGRLGQHLAAARAALATVDGRLRSRLARLQERLEGECDALRERLAVVACA